MLLNPRPPLEEILASIGRVIRTFRPPPHHATIPVWTKSTEGAPAGHWLLPAGCKVHVYNIPAKADPPCVIIAHAGEAEPMTEIPCVHWEIPVSISIIWPVQLRDSEVDLRLAALTAILTESLATGDAATVNPWARLSDSKVHVFNQGLRNVRPQPERTENNLPVLTLNLSIRCGLKAPA